jgi:four helix bundle protein
MMAFERLEAWRVAHELALAVFAQTDRWPRTELYGVTAQVRRAALSVPTNIAEGAAKRGEREFGRTCPEFCVRAGAYPARVKRSG